VGGREEIYVDTRIIAATNTDLHEAVGDGKFREDLFYRLNMFEMTLVSLRHRPEDIPTYVKRFLSDLKAPNLPEDVLKKILDYNWPGNLRELWNTIQRLVMLSDGRTMTLNDLPPIFSHQPKLQEFGSPYRSLEETEKEHILALLGREKNLEKVAEILGITKATLWRKRKQYGLI
jgi:transcriptional regulator with PAS, ATPase and Fis domain